MKFSIKLAVSCLAFIVGMTSVYLVWLISSSLAIGTSEISQIELSPQPTIKPSTSQIKETTIEEEWKYLIKADVCLNPEVNLPDYVPSLKTDEAHAVEFLISHIPDTQITNVHAAPYGLALRGEVAIYCLQDSWHMPWYKLKKEYEDQVERVLATNPGRYQKYLQSIIKSPKRSQEMIALWKKYYASRNSQANDNAR